MLVNPAWIITGDAADKTGNHKPVGIAARLDQECVVQRTGGMTSACSTRVCSETPRV